MNVDLIKTIQMYNKFSKYNEILDKMIRSRQILQFKDYTFITLQLQNQNYFKIRRNYCDNKIYIEKFIRYKSRNIIAEIPL